MLRHNGWYHGWSPSHVLSGEILPLSSPPHPAWTENQKALNPCCHADRLCQPYLAHIGDLPGFTSSPVQRKTLDVLQSQQQAFCSPEGPQPSGIHGKEGMLFALFPGVLPHRCSSQPSVQWHLTHSAECAAGPAGLCPELVTASVIGDPHVHGGRRGLLFRLFILSSKWWSNYLVDSLE